MKTTTTTGTCKVADLSDDRAYFWMSLPAKTRRALAKECGDHGTRPCVTLAEGRLYAA